MDDVSETLSMVLWMDCQPGRVRQLKLKRQSADYFLLLYSEESIWLGIYADTKSSTMRIYWQGQNFTFKSLRQMSALPKRLEEHIYVIKCFHNMLKKIEVLNATKERHQQCWLHFYLNQHCSFCFHHNFQQRFNQSLRGSWDEVE